MDKHNQDQKKKNRDHKSQKNLNIDKDSKNPKRKNVAKKA